MNGSAADPEARPLAGRRILVTRTREQAGALCDKLAAADAIAIDAPAIQLQDPPDWGPCDRALENLGQYRWIVFTSQTCLPMNVIGGGSSPRLTARWIDFLCRLSISASACASR